MKSITYTLFYFAAYLWLRSTGWVRWKDKLTWTKTTGAKETNDMYRIESTLHGALARSLPFHESKEQAPAWVVVSTLVFAVLSLAILIATVFC